MRHRLRQFAEAARPPSEADFTLARAQLPESLLALFLAQHPRDIAHSAATARWLVQRGHDDPDLVAAALLHDVGKGPQRRRDRVAFVVAASVGLANAAGSERSRFEMRRAVERTARHAEAGALALAAAGASERVVYLARNHHASPALDPVLALLQQADDAT